MPQFTAFQGITQLLIILVYSMEEFNCVLSVPTLQGCSENSVGKCGGFMCACAWV